MRRREGRKTDGISLFFFLNIFVGEKGNVYLFRHSCILHSFGDAGAACLTRKGRGGICKNGKKKISLGC